MSPLCGSQSPLTGLLVQKVLWTPGVPHSTHGRFKLSPPTQSSLWPTQSCRQGHPTALKSCRCWQVRRLALRTLLWDTLCRKQCSITLLYNNSNLPAASLLAPPHGHILLETSPNVFWSLCLEEPLPPYYYNRPHSPDIHKYQ